MTYVISFVSLIVAILGFMCIGTALDSGGDPAGFLIGLAFIAIGAFGIYHGFKASATQAARKNAQVERMVRHQFPKLEIIRMNGELGWLSYSPGPTLQSGTCEAEFKVTHGRAVIKTESPYPSCHVALSAATT